ncbi:MAG: hypothetical protein AAGD11_18075 [Planctomycetota bacterium]
MRSFCFVAMLLTLAPSVGLSAPLPYSLINTLTHPEPDRENGLRSVSLTDEYLFVGAPSFRIPGDSGQIFMYDVSGSNLLNTFDDPTPETLGFRSFAANESLLAVVDEVELFGRTRQVHLYDVDSGELRHTLKSPIAGHGGFAGNVAISGDHVIVGAYALGSTFGPTFPARVFVYDAVSGDLRHTFTPPDDVDTRGWGEVFDIFGSTLAIGAPFDERTPVLLYDAVSGQRTKSVKFQKDGDFDYLRIRDDRILLAQNLRDTYLLDTDGDLLNAFEFPDTTSSGGLLEFSGDNVLIGSFGSLQAGNTVTPAAWLYDGDSGELIQHFEDAAPSDRFVSMTSNPSGNQIALVKLFDGEVLVYSTVPEPTSLQLGAVLAAIFGTLSRQLPRMLPQS